jgi:hypothetical protein
MIDDPYEGSWRQRRHKRRVRIVAVVLALALVVPILVSSIAAISG